MTPFDTCATGRGGSDRLGDRVPQARAAGCARPPGSKSSRKQSVALFWLSNAAATDVSAAVCRINRRRFQCRSSKFPAVWRAARVALEQADRKLFAAEHPRQEATSIAATTGLGTGLPERRDGLHLARRPIVDDRPRSVDDETKLAQLHDDLLVVAIGGAARFLWYAVTPIEEQLLGPPGRRETAVRN